MRCHASFRDRLLTAGDTLKQGHTPLRELMALNVHRVGAGQSVLGDENGLFVPLDSREEFGGLTLE